MSALARFLDSRLSGLIGGILFAYGLLFANSGGDSLYRVLAYHVIAGSLLFIWLLRRQGAGWRLCAGIPFALLLVSLGAHQVGR